MLVLPLKVIAPPAGVPPPLVVSMVMPVRRPDLPKTVTAPPLVVTLLLNAVANEVAFAFGVPVKLIAPVFARGAAIKLPWLTPVAPAVPIKLTVFVVPAVQAALTTTP